MQIIKEKPKIYKKQVDYEVQHSQAENVNIKECTKDKENWGIQMKNKIQIFILLTLAILLNLSGNSEVYAAHISGCTGTGTTNKVTSTSAGSHTVTTYCTTCNQAINASTAAHDWNMTAATCTANKKCRTCNYIGQEATGHNYQTSYSSNGASQHYTQKCSNCGKKTTLADHTWNRTSASCTIAKSCTKCSYVAEAAKGHSWGTSYNSYSSTQHYTQKCSRCGSKTSLASHTWNVTSATCTTAKKCTACSYEAAAATGHDYYNKYTSSGSSGHMIFVTCRICGHVSSASSSPVAHSGGSATCTSTGTCQYCGEAYLAALGHTGGTHANGGKCTRSGCGVVYQTHSKTTTISSYTKTSTQHTPNYK